MIISTSFYKRSQGTFLNAPLECLSLSTSSSRSFLIGRIGGVRSHTPGSLLILQVTPAMSLCEQPPRKYQPDRVRLIIFSRMILKVICCFLALSAVSFKRGSFRGFCFTSLSRSSTLRLNDSLTDRNSVRSKCKSSHVGRVWYGPA